MILRVTCVPDIYARRRREQVFFPLILLVFSACEKIHLLSCVSRDMLECLWRKTLGYVWPHLSLLDFADALAFCSNANLRPHPLSYVGCETRGHILCLRLDGASLNHAHISNCKTPTSALAPSQ